MTVLILQVNLEKFHFNQHGGSERAWRCLLSGSWIGLSAIARQTDGSLSTSAPGRQKSRVLISLLLTTSRWENRLCHHRLCTVDLVIDYQFGLSAGASIVTPPLLQTTQPGTIHHYVNDLANSLLGRFRRNGLLLVIRGGQRPRMVCLCPQA